MKATVFQKFSVQNWVRVALSACLQKRESFSKAGGFNRLLNSKLHKKAVITGVHSIS